MMTLTEAAKELRVKLNNIKEVFTVGVNEKEELILVYCTTAKVWVDLPARFPKEDGFEVKMVVSKPPRPAQV